MATEQQERDELADLAPWLRDWRTEVCKHWVGQPMACCSPCLRDRFLASDWLTKQLTQAKAKALRDAAAAFTWAGDDEDYRAFRHWLTSRAEAIKAGR